MNLSGFWDAKLAVRENDDGPLGFGVHYVQKRHTWVPHWNAGFTAAATVPRGATTVPRGAAAVGGATTTGSRKRREAPLRRSSRGCSTGTNSRRWLVVDVPWGFCQGGVEDLWKYDGSIGMKNSWIVVKKTCWACWCLVWANWLLQKLCELVVPLELTFCNPWGEKKDASAMPCHRWKITHWFMVPEMGGTGTHLPSPLEGVALSRLGVVSHAKKCSCGARRHTHTGCPVILATVPDGSYVTGKLLCAWWLAGCKE